MIELNVGGVRYSTTKQTLIGSYFERRFSGTMDPGPVDASGAYFVDRNGRLFDHVLDYMRNLDRYVPSAQADLPGLMNEAVYFGLDGLIALLRPCLRVEMFEISIGYVLDGGLPAELCYGPGTPKDMKVYLDNWCSPPESIQLKQGVDCWLAARITQHLEKKGYQLKDKFVYPGKGTRVRFVYAFDPALYLRNVARQTNAQDSAPVEG